MTFLIEIGMWLGAGLLAAATLAPRHLAVAALAACSSALAFGALARVVGGIAWLSSEVHFFGLVAASTGAGLAAMAMRALQDAPFGRGPHSRPPRSRA